MTYRSWSFIALFTLSVLMPSGAKASLSEFSGSAQSGFAPQDEISVVTHANDSPIPDPQAQQRLLWFRTKRQAVKGVVVVVHGLNTKPSKMNSIVQTLTDDGYDALRVGLTGHLGDPEEFKQVTREKWVQEAHSAYLEARRLADEKKLPLHLVAYSLGALINIDLLNSMNDSKVHFDRMVLFAPAIAVKPVVKAVRALRFFGKNIVLFSLSNKDYRANVNGTPVGAYEALFQSLSQLSSTGIKQHDTPTLIIVDPKDELISISGLKEEMKSQNLTSWRLLEISNEGSTLTTGKYHHLIIDEPSLGVSEWRLVQSALLTHLSNQDY